MLAGSTKIVSPVLLTRCTEELVGEVAVRPRKERVGRGRQVVAVSWPAGAFADLVVGHEAVGRERHQVLAHAARGEAQLLGQLVGGELAPLLERLEDLSPGGRQRRQRRRRQLLHQR